MLGVSRSRGTSTSTGTGALWARSSRAAARPSSRRVGRMPAASCRRSVIVAPISSTAASIAGDRGRAASGRDIWRRRSRTPRETRRCCAPSCRSRSSLRRSAYPASTIRRRESSTSSSCRRSSARKRAISTGSTAAASTPCIRSGCSTRVGAWTRTAPLEVPAPIVVDTRLSPGDRSAAEPKASTRSRDPGKRKSRLTEGSCSASARTPTTSSGSRRPARTSFSKARRRRTPSCRAGANRWSTTL